MENDSPSKPGWGRMEIAAHQVFLRLNLSEDEKAIFTFDFPRKNTAFISW